MCLVSLCCWRLRSPKCLPRCFGGILLLLPILCISIIELKSWGLWLGEYMVMRRPTLIKSQAHEMTSNGILGYESRGSSMRYKALC